MLQPSLVPCLLPLIEQQKNFVYKVSQHLELKALFLKRIFQKQQEMWKISFGNVLTFQEKAFQVKAFQVIIISATLYSSSLPFFSFSEAGKDEGKREFSSFVAQ